MLTDHRPDREPVVRMTRADFDQLSALSAPDGALGASILSNELERALVVERDAAQPGFVRLGTQVEYVDLASGRTRVLTVVPPQEADIDRRRVSVLSPVGAALIGLAAGDSHSWTGDDGRRHVLVVVSLEDEHDAA